MRSCARLAATCASVSLYPSGNEGPTLLVKKKSPRATPLSSMPRRVAFWFMYEFALSIARPPSLSHSATAARAVSGQLASTQHSGRAPTDGSSP